MPNHDTIPAGVPDVPAEVQAAVVALAEAKATQARVGVKVREVRDRKRAAVPADLDAAREAVRAGDTPPQRTAVVDVAIAEDTVGREYDAAIRDVTRAERNLDRAIWAAASSWAPAIAAAVDVQAERVMQHLEDVRGEMHELDELFRFLAALEQPDSPPARLRARRGQAAKMIGSSIPTDDLDALLDAVAEAARGAQTHTRAEEAVMRVGDTRERERRREVLQSSPDYGDWADLVGWATGRR